MTQSATQVRAPSYLRHYSFQYGNKLVGSGSMSECGPTTQTVQEPTRAIAVPSSYTGIYVYL